MPSSLASRTAVDSRSGGTRMSVVGSPMLRSSASVRSIRSRISLVICILALYIIYKTIGPSEKKDGPISHSVLDQR